MDQKQLKIDTGEKSKGFRNADGFTLIEILIAVVVIAVSFAAIATVVASSIRGAQHSKHVTGAVTLIQDKLEGFKNTSYAAITSGNEANIDAEGNVPGPYSRTWTVTTVGSAKEITVVVTWPFNGLTKTRSMTTVISE
ncbi:hypothetical protein UR09_02935 [Candidatus Nitromaritima sp. SCGC AAA799-A02]|nr:hypothetical protein UR09_02935 [Candidatus Nitromaritima sp. SCGC AAA799-A02]